MTHNPNSKECPQRWTDDSYLELSPCTCEPKEEGWEDEFALHLGRYAFHEHLHSESFASWALRFIGGLLQKERTEAEKKGWDDGVAHLKRDLVCCYGGVFEKEGIGIYLPAISEILQKERERIWREARSLRKYEEDPIALSDLKQIINNNEA